MRDSEDISVFAGNETQEDSRCEHLSGNKEITLGSVTEIDSAGLPKVTFCGRTKVAMTTVALSPAHVGRQVALMFLNQDLSKPIVIGVIRNHLDEIIENMDVGRSDEVAQEDIEIEQERGSSSLTERNIYRDGKKLTIEGEEEVVLKCGDASISLNKSGKIVIRGKYVLSRASGVNRILGGSVQVN